MMQLPSDQSESNNPKEVDVLVIGSGLAGSMAALRAKELGASVAMLSKSDGASAYASGAINIADNLSIDDLLNVEKPWLSCLEDFCRDNLNQYHPYAVLGAAQRSKILRAVNLLSDSMPDLFFETEAKSKNQVLAAELGPLKHCALAQKSQLFDFAKLPRGARIGVVGISGLLGFETESVIKILEWAFKKIAHYDFKFEPVNVEFKSPNGFWKSPIQAATDFENPEMQRLFYLAFVESLKSHNPVPKHFLFPPMMGLESASHFLEKIERELRCSAKEFLAGSHSVPGLRLAKSLKIALEQKSIELFKDEVVGFDFEKNVISRIALSSGPELRPKAIILASGRYLGGGLELKSEWQEKIFKLPIFLEQKPYGEVHPTALSKADIFSGGLGFGENLKPLDAFSNEFAKNLFAAGSILGGSNSSQDGTASGVAILTGYLAGELAVNL